MKYLVKVFSVTGESLSFITDEIDDDVLPDLGHQEHLYFSLPDHLTLFDELVRYEPDKPRWYLKALAWMREYIINFTVHPVREQMGQFVGLNREAAARQAMEENLSFRVVLEDGVVYDTDDSYKHNRVNVYIDQDVVYKAEIY